LEFILTASIIVFSSSVKREKSAGANMDQIKNKNQLVENGQTETIRRARALALQSLECALKAVDPKQLLHSRLSLRESKLFADGFSFDLNKIKKIYVVGGGKASGVMAKVVEEILSAHLTAGIVNVPYGNIQKKGIIELHEANHPVPDNAGIDGTRRMVKLAEQATEDDLIICLISGGGSSLMPLPRAEVSLEEKRDLTAALLKSGAAINEINIVRKHLSQFKGGWLAKKAYPATVLNLILSDVVGDSLGSIASGPTVPDPSTFDDARSVLEKFHLWTSAPSSIRKVLSDGTKGIIAETPKAGDPAFEKVYSVVIGNNRTASAAAVDYLQSEGLNTFLLTDTLEGEAKRAGKAFALLARQVVDSNNPIPKPAGIVAGGETTVTVTGKGQGGRNQELALAAALNLTSAQACVIASLSTDGVDGPTTAAGAVVDGFTLNRAAKLGLNPEKFLANNDSNRFFSKLKDLIITGQTGTNVNDISVIVAL
jgi:glycerate 2-kinase